MRSRATTSNDRVTAGALRYPLARNRLGMAMGGCSIISGRPTEYGQAVQGTAEALNERHRFRGTVAPRNDNRLGGRHQDERAPRGAVGQPGLKLGVLRLGLEMLRGSLQVERALRRLERLVRFGVAPGARGSTKLVGLHGEGDGGAPAGGAKGQQGSGVGHGQAPRGDRHRGDGPDAGDGGADTR